MEHLTAVEVAGDASSDTESALRDKARWYLDAGVRVVWIVVPETRTVIVVTDRGATSLTATERLLPIPELPGLEPRVAELFIQVERRD